MDGVGDSLDLVPIGAWHGSGRKAGWYFSLHRTSDALSGGPFYLTVC